MMNDALLKLKKQAVVYYQKAIDVKITDDDQIFCQKNENKSLIHIGKKAPYRYVEHLHPEGYYLFLEGLNIHEIASLKYTDFSVLKNCFDNANNKLMETNIKAKQFLNKEIGAAVLKEQLEQYVYALNLPLLLKAIEDGAVENSMGIEHPETWTALMFTRNHISQAFMNKNQDVHDTRFLMDNIIKEIMLICTYGYRHHLYSGITYLPYYLSSQFEEIKQFAIQGRLQSHTTQERLMIACSILHLCQPVIHETVMEIFDTIQNSKSFENIEGNNLFSDVQNEISVTLQNNQNQSNSEKTKSKYHFDLSKEDYKRIEQIENQEEKQQQHLSLQEILKREKEREKNKEKKLNQNIINDDIENLIIPFPLQRTSPTAYGQVAKRHLNQSIQRSNKLARLLKREIMYASKNKTKNKLEYGKKLDQKNLYRATIDGRVFYEKIQGNKKDLCVYILVDNSESMSGEKIIYTMQGCFEVARVLQTLKIPFCISCHKAVGDSVQMTEIISFQECMKRQLLDRIFYMHISGGTHEEIALEKALKDLTLFKRNKKGFVFVLSDGDTHGIERIHDLTRIYKKEKNIDVIGIGIQTAKKIEETYPHGMFIEDINDLPTKLIEKLREITL